MTLNHDFPGVTRFRVKIPYSSHSYEAGDILTVYLDDGSYAPYFINQRTGRRCICSLFKLERASHKQMRNK